MAEPVQFDQVNTSWYGEGDVGALPVFRDTDTGENISCWELSAEEQIEVLRTDKIWLRVWGNHPPVYLEGMDPFIPELVNDLP